MSSPPRGPSLSACPGGRRLEVRGVAARARLHCGPVPGRRAALPGQTLIGFDTPSRRREGAFLLLFFFSSFISKREPFFFNMKSPSSSLLLLQLTLVLLCLSLLLALRSYIDSLCFFVPLPLLDGPLFLLSSFIRPLTWMVTSKFDPQHQNIKKKIN